MGSDARTYYAAGNTTDATLAGETWGYGYDHGNHLTVVQRDGNTVATITGIKTWVMFALASLRASAYPSIVADCHCCFDFPFR